MKSVFLRIAKLLILVLPILGLLAACAAKAPLTDGSVENLIDDIEKTAGKVSRLRIDFVKTRRSSLFNRELTVQGRLVFQKPNKFRVTTIGDVNVEILSDGKLFAMVHDLMDQEIHHIQDERDLSAIADPLIALVDRLVSGSLRTLSIKNRSVQGNSIMVEVEPGRSTGFEQTDRIHVWFSKRGDLERVKLVFRNGDVDVTKFRSWSMLAPNDPELLMMDQRLSSLSRQAKMRSNETPGIDACCFLRVPPSGGASPFREQAVYRTQLH